MKRNLAAPKPQCSASIQNSGELEILAYDDIGYNYWNDSGVTAKGIKFAIDSFPNATSISLRINSPGGDAFEGMTIYSLLRQQSKKVNVYIDGIAASAASIIAMAGDTITISNVGMMMVHNAWFFCEGNANHMRKCADTLDKVSTAIAQAYVDKTGKTADEIKAIMDEETWMGAQECVDAGFAHAIAKPTAKDREAAMALAASFRSLAKLKHVPSALVPKADAVECACDCQPCMDGDCTNCVVSGCNGDLPCDCDRADVGNAGNLSQYEARLRLLGR
jgi:ATP-dependent protease ClpP protease subunit